MLLSGKCQIHSWGLSIKDVLQITYTTKNGFVDTNLNINVVIAVQELELLRKQKIKNFLFRRFTICCARLQLYHYMAQMQDRLLYFDTDQKFFLR